MTGPGCSGFLLSRMYKLGLKTMSSLTFCYLNKAAFDSIVVFILPSSLNPKLPVSVRWRQRSAPWELESSVPCSPLFSTHLPGDFIQKPGFRGKPPISPSRASGQETQPRAWFTAVQLLTEQRQSTAVLENPPWPCKEGGGCSLETGSHRQSPLGQALHFLRKAPREGSSTCHKARYPLLERAGR